VAFDGKWARLAAIAPRLDGEGEFGEGRHESMFRVGIRAEFVVAATDVLDEGVPALITRIERSCLMPRIGRSRALSRP
jgi:hypothetical protein